MVAAGYLLLNSRLQVYWPVYFRSFIAPRCRDNPRSVWVDMKQTLQGQVALVRARVNTGTSAAGDSQPWMQRSAGISVAIEGFEERHVDCAEGIGDFIVSLEHSSFTGNLRVVEHGERMLEYEYLYNKFYT